MVRIFRQWFWLVVWSSLACAATAADLPHLKILFLGDNGHHQPAARYQDLAPALQERGIELRYTDDVNQLSLDRLNQFDGLVVYANIDEISPEQADALLEYVNSGKGFIPLHCATYCFRNSDQVVALMGGQFKRHGTGVFSTVLANEDHPIMQGFGGFRSWDETYIHHLHNEENRTVLEYRKELDLDPGQTEEPWTWVRTHGQGRVFYTAWGHDQRTWEHPGFQNLVERGIRWACGQDPSLVPAFVDTSRFDIPQMTSVSKDVKPFEYEDVGPKIPNYTPGARWGVQGEPQTLMQKPLPPEESIKHYVTPQDFEMQLFASEANFDGKPIAMTWDEQGRLWICETVDYPNELQPETGRDHIRICEDTDGDHVADKFTLFAEGLSIPTAITPYKGGVIVQNGVETLFLKDTDGDDKADVRKVLISNWALGDTHGGVSNFQYGLDNWIWAMQGYNNSAPIINGQEQQSFRMGFFRFKLSDADPPEVTEIEFIRSTNNNTWGLGISEEGIIFGSTANHNPSVYMPIPNRYYEAVRGWAPQQLGTIADSHLFKPITEKVRQVDQFGGYTAGAGHALYTARTYPSTWWNRTAFVCGPTGHLVGTFVISKDGADFTSTSPSNLVAADDEWAAPIMAEVGPDGNVWVLDWYNYIVQHNPTPQGFQTGKGNAYESDLRDKKHGRIYRVVYTAGDEVEVHSLADASIEELVQTLAHPTMLWRKQAQRLLVEKADSSAVSGLIELVKDKSQDAIGLNVGAIHALWTLHGLGELNDPSNEAFKVAVEALKHPSAGVRRNAVAVLPAAKESTAAIVAANVLSDNDPQVQLAAVLALADMPEADDAGQKVAGLAGQAQSMNDRWLGDAVTAAGAKHAVSFLAGLAETKGEPNNRALEAASVVAEHIARGKPDSPQLEKLLDSLAAANSKVATAVINGVTKGWPTSYQPELTDKLEDSLLSALKNSDADSKADVIRLASLLGSRKLEEYAAEISKELFATASDEAASSNARVAAASQIISLQAGSDDVVDELLSLVTPNAVPEFSTGVMNALRSSKAPGMGKLLAENAALGTPSMRETAISVLLTRPEATAALLNAIQAGDLSLGDVKLDQKQLLSNYPDQAIRQRAQEVLAAGGQLPNADRQKVLDELMPVTHMTGDATAGKEIFKKHCAKCHKHSGEGENIGPELTGMAVHPKEELLMHIIDPSRSVEGNFRIYSAVLTNGRVISGMLAGESRTSVELIDAEAKRHPIPRSDLEELTASKKSLMPEGFEKQMTKDELSNLLEFLTAKGKYVPLDLRKVASVVSTTGMFSGGRNRQERMVFPDWSPKTFEGVPFQLIDPQGDTVPNMLLMYGPNGTNPPRMPKEVSLPVNAPAKAIHMLSGVSGWGSPYGQKGSVSVIVRITYDDGSQEEHELQNGIHFADYITRVDVPESKFAYDLRGRQIRYLVVEPKESKVIRQIDLVKGPDNSAPMVMAITVETPDA